MKAELQPITLYLTPEHPCSYLEEQQATTVFADPSISKHVHLYSQLTQLGFRRSGEHLYKPHCNQCNACISARIPVQEFIWARKFKRVLQKNQDLDISVLPMGYTPERYDLYAHYVCNRHGEGDMYPPSIDQFKSFLICSWQESLAVEFRLQDQLIAVAVIDELEDGLSAIYTFFDTQHKQRSLGKLAILWQIQHALQNQLAYIYLGYWISNCDKMSYKANFQPLDLLLSNGWQRMTKPNTCQP